jgi:hypothetical protein
MQPLWAHLGQGGSRNGKEESEKAQEAVKDEDTHGIPEVD